MARRKKEPECRSWIVRAECHVTKEIICEDCTEEQARNDPFEHAVDENEIHGDTVRVVSVEPNV